MNVNVLIDAIVRQTTILLAQLATASGTRANVANVANQVFLDLVTELKAQGVGNKVIADMFGMVLRSYHKKVRRLSESATDRGRSLWDAVYTFVQEQDTVGQGALMQRFRHDDNETVRGVMRDLVESGLVFRAGRGANAVYRVAGAEEIAHDPQNDLETFANFIWAHIYRTGPVRLADISDALRTPVEDIEPALEALIADKRVSQTGRDEEACYETREFVIPFETDVGWEAAVFDHFQALVTTINAKLQQGRAPAARTDEVGGSTYSFDLWPGHELETEALQMFRRVRADASDLRSRVDAYNAVHRADESAFRVTFYVGQNIAREEPHD